MWPASSYRAAEYIMSASADVYRPVSMADAMDVGPRDATKDLGARDFVREVLAANQPYKTRLIVYRPADPRRFSGTVIVETLHANGGGTSLVWRALHGFFAARGYASKALHIQRYAGASQPDRQVPRCLSVPRRTN
jgi:hypothetical protein